MALGTRQRQKERRGAAITNNAGENGEEEKGRRLRGSAGLQWKRAESFHQSEQMPCFSSHFAIWPDWNTTRGQFSPFSPDLWLAGHVLCFGTIVWIVWWFVKYSDEPVCDQKPPSARSESLQSPLYSSSASHRRHVELLPHDWLIG